MLRASRTDAGHERRATQRRSSAARTTPASAGRRIWRGRARGGTSRTLSGGAQVVTRTHPQRRSTPSRPRQNKEGEVLRTIESTCPSKTSKHAVLQAVLRVRPIRDKDHPAKSALFEPRVATRRSPSVLVRAHTPAHPAR